jgi:hypothetical protein
VTKFEDGPAAGVMLALRRSPLYLRVVRDAEGKFDALDRLDDEPAAGEALFAYRLVKSDGVVHLSMTDRRGRRCGGFYAMAGYAVVEDQPPDEVMRDTEKWREWATARHAQGPR